MDYLLPGEHLTGTPSQRRQLHRMLRHLRTGSAPDPLPSITFISLTDLLGTDLIDTRLFTAGRDLTAARYARYGISTLLPPGRVWAGIRSSAPAGSARAHGGFHHPGQGYRHLQATMTVTIYGDLTRPRPASPQIIALDLLRSYAHDTLHYAAFRRYQLTPASPQPAEPADYAIAEAVAALRDDAIPRARSSPSPYLRALGGFSHDVTMRYRKTLAELAEGTSARSVIHHQVVTAMITGDLPGLQARLDRLHGNGSFAARFRQHGWPRHVQEAYSGAVRSRPPGSRPTLRTQRLGTARATA